MKVGIYVFATDQFMSPGELGKEAEDRGFDSLFFPEHSHIPVSRATDYPDSYGGGIENQGMLTLSNVTLTGNSATNSGGAVDSHQPSPASQQVSSGSSGGRRSDLTAV